MGEWNKNRIDKARKSLLNGVESGDIPVRDASEFAESLDEIELLQNEVSVRDGLLEQMANETGNEILGLRNEIKTLNKFYNSNYSNFME